MLLFTLWFCFNSVFIINLYNYYAATITIPVLYSIHVQFRLLVLINKHFYLLKVLLFTHLRKNGVTPCIITTSILSISGSSFKHFDVFV